MSHDEDAALVGKDVFADEFDDVPARFAVERGGGLIENQDVRTADDGPGDRHPLLLAAAQLHRRQLRPILQADDLEIHRRLFERVVPFALLQNERDRDILGGGEARKEMVVLKHEADLVQPELGERIVAEASIFRYPRSSRCRSLGRRIPEIMLSMVVLPLPDGPTT